MIGEQTDLVAESGGDEDADWIGCVSRMWRGRHSVYNFRKLEVIHTPQYFRQLSDLVFLMTSIQL